MKQDKHTTRVIFRDVTYGEGDTELLAIFPDSKPEMYCGKGENLRTCYAHIGQYSECDIKHIMKISKPALPSEAMTDLIQELKGLGYNLKIIKRVRN